ncbi:hypothetical protein D3C80_1644610 [compost metagenome]
MHLAPTVRDCLNRELFNERAIAFDMGVATKRHPHRTTDTDGMCRKCGNRIIHQPECGVLRVIGNEGSQHAGSIGITTRTGIVLCIGDDHRLAGAPGNTYGLFHALVGCVDLAGERAFAGIHQCFEIIHGGISGRLCQAVTEDGGTAFVKICGWKARHERQ